MRSARRPTSCSLDGGYNKQLLVDAFRLLLNSHWSTTQCEQVHGAMAVTHRLHPDYTEETLLTRATWYRLQGVLGFTVPKGPNRVYAIKRKIEKLEHSEKQKGTGRQLYLADRIVVAPASPATQYPLTAG